MSEIAFRIAGFVLCPECAAQTELPREGMTERAFGMASQTCHGCGEEIYQGALGNVLGEAYGPPSGRVVVDWGEVLGKTEVVPDDDSSERPWDNCDGFDHEIETTTSDMEDARGHVWWDRGRHLITLDDRIWTDEFKYARKHGASRQVAREYADSVCQGRLDQLTKWYSDGWERWGVVCEIEGDDDPDSPWFGFDGWINESVWGIDDSAYAEKDVVPEIAEEAAHALEKEGNIVLGRPTRLDRKRGWRENRRHYLGWQVSQFAWKGDDNYTAPDGHPLVKRGIRVRRATYRSFGEWYAATAEAVSVS